MVPKSNPGTLEGVPGSLTGVANLGPSRIDSDALVAVGVGVSLAVMSLPLTWTWPMRLIAGALCFVATIFFFTRFRRASTLIVRVLANVWTASLILISLTLVLALLLLDVRLPAVSMGFVRSVAIIGLTATVLETATLWGVWTQIREDRGQQFILAFFIAAAFRVLSVVLVGFGFRAVLEPDLTRSAFGSVLIAFASSGALDVALRLSAKTRPKRGPPPDGG